jgi:hypothetical protein
MASKENKSPYLPSYTSTANNSIFTNYSHSSSIKQSNGASKPFRTPSNAEIVSAAQRILSQRNSNSQPIESSITNATKSAPHSESLVKSIKSRFENGKFGQQEDALDSNNSSMTPKSIIQKFEQMLKDGTQVQPLTGAVALSSNSATSSSSLNAASVTKKQCTEANQSNKKNVEFQSTNTTPATTTKDQPAINTDHIKPKKIIEQFESLVKSQQQISLPGPIPTTFSCATISSTTSNESNLKKSSIVSASGSYYTTGI